MSRRRPLMPNGAAIPVDLTSSVAFLWPSADAYLRFVELFGPDLHPSYSEFLAVSVPRAIALEQQGFHVVRVDFDPDDMARWCLAKHGHLGPEARSAYAAYSAATQEVVPAGRS